MHLKEFISEQNKAIFRLVSPVSKDYGSLLYLKSLAFGLDSVLNEYRQHLVKQEQKVSNCICIVQYCLTIINTIFNLPPKFCVYKLAHFIALSSVRT